MIKKLLLRINLITALLILSGCASQPAQSTPLATPNAVLAGATPITPQASDPLEEETYLLTLAAGPSWTPGPTRTPSSTPTPTATPAPLSDVQPWLLFVSDSEEDPSVDNLWAVNADGSGLNRLINEDVIDFAVQPARTRTGGVLVAVATRTDYESRDLNLKLLHLPEGTLETITPLIVDRPDQPPVNTYDAELSIEEGGLLWSEDGNRLAFVGQIDGPTMDVYIYDTRNQSITRVSSGDMQAFSLQWSPDGAWLIHGGYTFIGMGGPSTEALWAAHTNGTGSIALAGDGKPLCTSSGSIVPLGWLDSSHFLLHSLQYEGTDGICSIDITTGATNLIFETDFASATYSPPTGVWLVTGSYTSKNPDPPDRLFRAGTFVDLPDYGLFDVRWSDEMQAFLGTSIHEKLYTISASGDYTEMAGFDLAHVSGAPRIIASPDGSTWAWHTYWSHMAPSGVWVGPSKAVPTRVLGEHFDNEFLTVSWSPDSQRLFMQTGNGIWMLVRPDFTPVSISDYRFPSGIRLEWVP